MGSKNRGLWQLPAIVPATPLEDALAMGMSPAGNLSRKQNTAPCRLA